MQSGKEGSLDVRIADKCARSFNMVFNNTLTYGTSHPVSAKCISDFMENLHATLEHLPMITFMLERDALYLEEERVDTKMSAKRLILTMKKSGIQSITFEKNIGESEVTALLTMLKESGHFQGIDQMLEYLSREKVSRIRLNYVLYQKVTADESVVKGNEPPGQQAPSAGATLDQKTLRGLTALFSMSEVLRDPRHVAKGLVSAAADTQQGNSEAVLSYVRRIGDQIEKQEQSNGNVSPEQIAESVLSLKQDLHQGLEIQKQLGNIISDEGALINEVDRLTYQAIVKIAREEFRTGNISVKRLATIIRRMLPDLRELQRLLPVLKEGLLEEGMQLGDFLELVRSLNFELKSENVADALEQGASEIGLSAEDIIANIKQNPGEAARLIVLASEIRNGTDQDESQLSSMLTEYIEQVSSQMTLRSKVPADSSEGSNAMSKMLSELEQQLLTKVRSQGLSENLMRLVQEELSRRLPSTKKRLKESWIREYLEGHEDLTAVDLVHLLGGMVENQAEFDEVRGTVCDALTKRGYDPGHVQEVCEKVSTRLSVRESVSSKLPRGVLNVNNTVFFLQREIGLYLRYNNVFSALMVTIAGIRDESGWRKPTNDDAATVFPTVFSILTGTLRDLDIIGSMGAIARNVPFVILSMTDRQGAGIVKHRLTTQLQNAAFGTTDKPKDVQLALSVTTFDKDESHDLKGFLALVKKRHAMEEQRITEGTAVR